MFRAIAYASEDAYNNDRDDYTNAVVCATQEEADQLASEWGSRYGFVRTAEFGDDGEEVRDADPEEVPDDETDERPDADPEDVPDDVRSFDPSDSDTRREV